SRKCILLGGTIAHMGMEWVAGGQPRLAADETIAHYRLECRLGEGGMCEVWLASDTRQGRTVALKLLLPAARAHPEIVARFRREAELLARIDSSHVPSFYEFAKDERYGYVLVEEFIRGESLAGVIETRRLSVQEGLSLGLELARALVELHRAGVVHRDLKPGNILLAPKDAASHRVVLIDLGVSRLSVRTEGENTEGLTEITRPERALGT